MIKVFGLKQCSTCVKAKKWLDEHQIVYEWIDVRQQVPSSADLRQWSKQRAWTQLVNTRSQTWRQLPEHLKSPNSDQDYIQLIQAHPSLLKRPLLLKEGDIQLGFSEDSYQAFFKGA